MSAAVSKQSEQGELVAGLTQELDTWTDPCSDLNQRPPTDKKRPSHLKFSPGILPPLFLHCSSSSGQQPRPDTRELSPSPLLAGQQMLRASASRAAKAQWTTRVRRTAAYNASLEVARRTLRDKDVKWRGDKIGQNVFISHRKYQGDAEAEVALEKEGLGSRNDWLRWKKVAIKDNIVTSDLPTTCASGILQTHQSPFDAGIVEKLRSVDSFINGKTNMDEFGMGSHSTYSFFGTVIPPHNLGMYSAGGSSGGSAVAVESAECDIALGTDTGGSVRLPAAYSGVVGFKPSYGIISRWGVVPYANSLDTVGILARSSKQVLQSFVSMRKTDSRDPTSLTESSRERIWGLRWDAYNKSRDGFSSKTEDQGSTFDRLIMEHLLSADAQPSDQNIRKEFRNLRIGVPTEYNISELEHSVKRAWTRTLRVLQQQGCTIVPISLPNTEHALGAYYTIAAAEAASNLSKYDGVRYGTRSDHDDGAGGVLYSKSRGEGFGDEVKRRILLGSYVLSSAARDNYFIKAQKVRRLVQRDFDRVFSMPNPLRDPEQFDLSDMDESIELDSKLGPSQVDLIVCPTAPNLAPKFESLKKAAPVDSFINDVFTVPSSLAGLPAISIPLKRRDKEGPQHIGMQIIGQFSDDVRVIAAAHEIEKLLKFDGRKWKEYEKKAERTIGESQWLRLMKTPVIRNIETEYGDNPSSPMREVLPSLPYKKPIRDSEDVKF
ncbi:Glutamyl-tRNA(Gln) amidotransferase subunit A [Lachnellula suecica]|uniref:Glutamyl-tRNA(Gln) amidotransferase subunit A, mitochondrial n=1 Tax=Lachnellula suecica TaxID=602035 RepID=A0A8T9BYJ9_9HELO|nr:Glutamyl-tRNA(Gln) amidotransferase subunit A [Lachnellula suecica]